VLCLVVVALAAPVTSDRPGDVPTGLDAALDRLPPGTRVLNDYDVGGWMVWRHPDLEHYIDGSREWVAADGSKRAPDGEAAAVKGDARADS